MIHGLRCAPATHSFVPHGKVLFCSACADVQPLLLDEPPAFQPALPSDPYATALERALEPPAPEHEPTSQELEAAVQRLREAAGLMQTGDQTELPLSEDDEELVRQSNAYGVRRVHVDNFDDQRSDVLPEAGL